MRVSFSRRKGRRVSAWWAVIALGVLALGGGVPAWADAAGRWQTFDAKTGEPRSVVEISKSGNGTYAGRVVEILKPSDPTNPNPTCGQCSDDRKGLPVLGLEIIRDMRTEDGQRWSGGTILDPAEGKVYRSKMRLIEQGTQLEVSGCVAFICRDQVWQRHP